MTSSTVTMPRSFSFVVDDRDRVDVVLGDHARDFLLVGVGAHRQQPPLHHVGDLPVRRRGEEPAQGHVPDEPARLVDGVEALHRLDLGVDAS